MYWILLRYFLNILKLYWNESTRDHVACIVIAFLHKASISNYFQNKSNDNSYLTLHKHYYNMFTVMNRELVSFTLSCIVVRTMWHT